MPAICEECGEEKGYDDVITLDCELGYEHAICKACMRKIKMKAKSREFE